MKTCPDCGQTKPLREFPRNAGRRDGYGRYCKRCYSIRYRTHRQRKAAGEGRILRERRAVAQGNKWCPACRSELPVENFPRNRASRDGRAGYCKPCHNARTRETKQRLYGGTREYHLRARYGITGADVEAMIAAQGGTCAVCDGKPEHVDHDHKTAQVRGVLCFNCNQALGNMRDDIDVLRRLARYLLDARFRALGMTVTEVEAPRDVVFELAPGFHAA